MIKKILNQKSAQILSKKEQQKINGGATNCVTPRGVEGVDYKYPIYIIHIDGTICAFQSPTGELITGTVMFYQTECEYCKAD